MWKCFLCGVFTGYIAEQLVERVSWQLTVTSSELGVSIRAEQQSSEKSCRRTDPAILEERQRVKIKCEDSASVTVNCSEL
jgi:hypothetical protein